MTDKATEARLKKLVDELSARVQDLARQHDAEILAVALLIDDLNKWHKEVRDEISRTGHRDPALDTFQHNLIAAEATLMSILSAFGGRTVEEVKSIITLKNLPIEKSA